MPARWRWILVLAVTTALDLLARFSLPFDFARVMHIEAALFSLTAVALGLLLRSEPRSHGWPRALKLGLIWLFALGGLRPLLWTIHVPLLSANLATFLVALVGVLIWVARRRRRRVDAADHGGTSA
jgi:hypothetical protein